MNPVHGNLNEEVSGDKWVVFKRDLDESVALAQWPPAYTQHPVTQSSVENLVPVAMLVDGASFQKRDIVNGFWFFNLLTKMRHLCCVVRRKRRRGICYSSSDEIYIPIEL